ncbi:MAG TPA: hypothetical protein VI503_01780 [Gaiellaceae bacterium]|nr:hypothetical protein [Gaiellaceae bacterium]HLF68047.1 hypothetical protein [Gaiellaceae bacterium]
MGHNRDQWNSEAVLVALYPWELDVVERALTCLAELAATQPDWEGSPRGPALAVAGKLDEVLEHQGYGGIDGVRQLLDGRSV